MEANEFWKELLLSIDFPFEPEEVKEIISNCGTTWIDLKDGRSFYISIEPCEPLNK